MIFIIDQLFFQFSTHLTFIISPQVRRGVLEYTSATIFALNLSILLTLNFQRFLFFVDYFGSFATTFFATPANALFPTFTFLLSASTFFSALQSANALLPIVFTFFPITTLVSLVHFLNAPAFTAVTL